MPTYVTGHSHDNHGDDDDCREDSRILLVPSKGFLIGAGHGAWEDFGPLTRERIAANLYGGHIDTSAHCCGYRMIEVDRA
jgi:hypothetical protein